LGLLFVKHKGIFTIEAIICFFTIAAITLVIISQPQTPTQYFVQNDKASDLLIVWATRGDTIEEMEKDANMFLGKGEFRIEYRQKSIGEIFEHEIVREIEAEGGKIKLFLRN